MADVKVPDAKIAVLDPAAVTPVIGTSYPAPYDRETADREKRRLGDALGLRNFGVNVTRLAPGVWSAQRHWHTRQDEFTYVLPGEITLVTESGEQVLTRAPVSSRTRRASPTRACLDLGRARCLT